ncbi:MAG: tetratricopeptide repeat protein [Gammaproteobacteria bacterium]|nr:tetratricopeptide repeat protein [Gammaproteobacteria bacterium]
MLHYWTERAWPCLAAALLVLTGCASAPERSEQAVEVDGDKEPSYPQAALEKYAYALGLMDAGRFEEAVAAMRKLTEKYPEYAGPYTNLAILAAAGGDDDSAAAYLQQALDVCSNCAPTLNQIGIMHRKAGRFAAAEEAYLAAVENDPSYALAYYNLGVLYDLYRQQHELAVEHYEHYVALSGDAERTKQVGKWIADLRRRLGESPRTAQAGGEL